MYIILLLTQNNGFVVDYFNFVPVRATLPQKLARVFDLNTISNSLSI